MVHCKWCNKEKEKLKVIQIDKDNVAVCPECAEEFEKGRCRNCGKESKFLYLGLCTDCVQVELALRAEQEDNDTVVEETIQCNQSVAQKMNPSELRSFIIPPSLSDENILFSAISNKLENNGYPSELIDANKDTIIKLAMQYKKEIRSNEYEVVIKRTASDIRGKNIVDCDGNVFIFSV